MLQSLMDTIRRHSSRLAAAGAFVVIFAAPLSAMPPLPPDEPRDERVASPDPDPLVVVMTDADQPAAATGAAKPAAPGATLRSQPTRACKRMRVTVVRPDGRVETTLVAPRSRQLSPSGD